MLALSIRQPWAWLIVHGWKDIENRSWATKIRGNFLIHAGKGMTHDEYDEAREVTGRIRSDLEGFPDFDDLLRGGIVGSAQIVGCVRASDSPWFFGEYGFVIRYAREVPFIPCRGRLGFFDA